MPLLVRPFLPTNELKGSLLKRFVLPHTGDLLPIIYQTVHCTYTFQTAGFFLSFHIFSYLFPPRGDFIEQYIYKIKKLQLLNVETQFTCKILKLNTKLEVLERILLK